ncbi:MAG: hypothetical protein QOF49_1070, partial [Chloroflexota bacterium]|nr:hypothetical protein [Chloroflexota bacterium]
MPTTNIRKPIPADEAVPTSETVVADRPDDAPAAADGSGFAGLGLDERLVTALAGLGYEEPTP